MVTAMFPHTPSACTTRMKGRWNTSHKGNTKVNKTPPEDNVIKVQVQNLKQFHLCQPRLATKPHRSVFSFLLIRKQISREDKVLADKIKIKALGSNVGSHWPLASE